MSDGLAVSGTLETAAVGGLELLVSPRLRALGVCHGFTTRRGGASEGPFASLNLGFSTGDRPAAVLANRARVCEALGKSAESLRFVTQVHGQRLVEPQEDWPSGADAPPPEADGLVSGDPRWLLGVRGADCLMVLLAAAGGQVVAAVHAGWRGLVQEILPRAVAEVARRAGEPPTAVVAAIGPGIGAARYEVGPEVAAQFAPDCLRPSDGATLLDLAACAEGQLRAAGLTAIDQAHRCTFEQAEDFYSYRRDGARTGRHGALIAASPS